MKKIAIAAAFSLLMFFNSYGQYVTIPDLNFLAWMENGNLSGCLNLSGQLDTTCPELLQDTIVNCSVNQIYNLEGIQYFKNLRYLDCSYNFLDSLPSLPLSLRELICYDNKLQTIGAVPDSLILINCAVNKLVSLPALPNGIRFIDCGANNITALPSLPSALVTLYCGGNSLDSLPILPSYLDTLYCNINYISKFPSFPNSLHFLNCQQNLLATLPPSTSLKYLYADVNKLTSLPIYDSLYYLTCTSNQITRLPVFPNSLVYLNCAYNNIDSIIYLPNSLTDIQCQDNQLKSLGTRLPDSLHSLDCDNNLLTVLPPLPKTLSGLACFYNLLTELPALPDSIDFLGCQDNPYLQCLPKLTRIIYLYFDSTAITCIPNYGNVTNSTPPLGSLPLCTTGNANGCPAYTSIPEIKDLEFSMYPNPANDYVSLALNEEQGEFTVAVNDVTGGEVMRMGATNSNCELRVKGLPNGLYFVRVINGRGDFGVRKLVVDK